MKREDWGGLFVDLSDQDCIDDKSIIQASVEVIPQLLDGTWNFSFVYNTLQILWFRFVLKLNK